MQTITPELISHWRSLCTAEGTPLTRLSIDIGKDRTYLPQLLSQKGTQKRKSEPSVFTMMRLAARLRIPFDHLMMADCKLTISNSPGYSEEIHRQSARLLNDVTEAAKNMLILNGSRPSIDDIIGWWHSSNGRLDGCGQIEETFDLIHVPRGGAETVTPYRVGSESLAAQKLGTNAPERLGMLVETFDDEARKELVVNYQAAARAKDPLIKIRTANICTRDGAHVERVEYFRLNLPVVAADNTPFILNFCTTLSGRSPALRYSTEPSPQTTPDGD